MNSPNNAPNPGGGRDRAPDDYPDPLAGEHGGGPRGLNEVKAVLGTPLGKALAVAPVVVGLALGFVLGQTTASPTSPGMSAAGNGSGVTTTAVTTVTVAKSSTGGSSTATSQSLTGGGTAAGAVGGAVGGSGSTAGGSLPGGAGSSPSSTATSSVPAPPDAPTAGTVTLTTLTPVLGPFKSVTTAPMLNGKPQLSALVQDVGCFNPTNGDLGYDLGRNYTQISGLLGLDDKSAMSSLKPVVEIDGDGLKLATFTPTLGHPVQVTVNVTNVLRLDVKWSAPEANCVQGSSAPAGALVFGGGQLTTVPGFHPTPPTASTT